MRCEKCVFLLLFTLLSFTGCAVTTVTQTDKVIENKSQEDEMLAEFAEEVEVKEVFDPLSGYNRIMTGINDNIYENVLAPISDGYGNVVNKDIRESVERFFKNLYFPVRFVNNILQLKFKYAFEESERFVLNTTIGFLGFFDPAKNEFGIMGHDEDFGQTLGFYGVGSGPHIVLPLFGPSNLRDTLSMVPDGYLSPLDSTQRGYWTLTDTLMEYSAAKSYETINDFSLNGYRYEKLKEDAIDLYAYLRDVYEQYRDNEIKE